MPEQEKSCHRVHRVLDGGFLCLRSSAQASLSGKYGAWHAFEIEALMPGHYRATFTIWRNMHQRKMICNRHHEVANFVGISMRRVPIVNGFIERAHAICVALTLRTFNPSYLFFLTWHGRDRRMSAAASSIVACTSLLLILKF